MSTQIKAPWTEEQVKNLNEYQVSGKFHPFTCGGTGCAKDETCNYGILTAKIDGWYCPCNEWKQNWAHRFMAEDNNETIQTTEI